MSARGTGPVSLLRLALALTCSACATLVTGTRERISIRTEPSGASVSLAPGHYEARTPATFELPRAGAPYLVTVSLEGYEPQRSYLRAEPNAWLWGNILIGGVIGIALDWAFGAINDLEPDQIDLVLQPLPAAPPEGASE